MRTETKGFVAVIAAALLWGVGSSVAKFLFNQAVSPFLLVKLRLTLSCLILVVSLAVFRPRLLKIDRQDWSYFACLGIGGMAMMQFFYFYTISLTNVATAIFLQYLSPVLMAGYAVLSRQERFTTRRAAAVILATLGGLFILLNSGGMAGINLMGSVSGLLAAVFMAFTTVYGRRGARRYHAITVSVYSFGFGAVLWWIILPGLWEPGTITGAHWLMFWYVAIFSTVLPFLLYFVGISYLPPTLVGITACLEPVVAAVTAYLALGEQMGFLQMMGGSLVIGAVILVQTEKTEDDQTGTRNRQ